MQTVCVRHEVRQLGFAIIVAVTVALTCLATFSVAVPTNEVRYIPSRMAAPQALGKCSMYDECGSKGILGGQLPCPSDQPAVQSSDPNFITALAEVCGRDFAPDNRTCCSLSQLETLRSSLSRAEPLIASCPACRNNFANFYCHFTCSPDQRSFVDVVQTQRLSNGRVAVREVDVRVSPEFGDGFFQSCQNVKFGATNGFAMDLLGGGATNYLDFLRYMGKERALGSPFQISFPDNPSSNTSLSPPPLSCASHELNARCACSDCPFVCPSLPHVASPAERATHRCNVGRMSCFAFSLVILYGAALTAGIVFVFTTVSLSSLTSPVQFPIKWASLLVHRSPTTSLAYDRVPLSDPLASNDSDEAANPTSRSNSANRSSVTGGASTSIPAGDGESLSSRPRASTSGTSSYLSNTAPPSADPTFVQPRSYPLNTSISSFFYTLGLFCASYPWVTLAIAFTVCAVLNSGWSHFEIERDPVRLWVSNGSNSARHKSRFDHAFGPFFRTEQIFLTRAPVSTVPLSPEGGGTSSSEKENSNRWTPVDAPVLTWSVLQWWATVEADIRALTSPSGLTLANVCLSPTEKGACVVESPMGYFQDSLEHVTEATWAASLDACASSPATCLPKSGAPLNPALVLGGIPQDDRGRAHDARAVIVTYVLKSSLDHKMTASAEEWEETLSAYLRELQVRARLLGLQVAFSTGTSLESELSKSAKTDVKTAVLSYTVMFLYVAVNLGGSGAALAKMAGRGVGLLAHGAVWAFQQGMSNISGRQTRRRSDSITLSLAGSTSRLGAYFWRQVLVDSKVTLGLCGIVIVLLSVSTSIGFFSFMGVKSTLIIAEVIPFLVLAVGVDNIFLLSHALEQQNAHAYATTVPFGDDELDFRSPAEERTARALAHIGPSILLSASTQTIAFSLGAFVGMPAVQNFAIYAAGAVVVNAVLQVTVFVAVMAIDLQRVEANRIDCLPFLKLAPTSSIDLGATTSEGIVARFIRTKYTPVLLSKPVKAFVLALFGGLFVLSWISARHIHLGLALQDQRQALPTSSYLVDYFNAADTYLDVGPPVYFVSELDPTTRTNQKHLCGRFSTCDELSMANVLEAERKRPESSFLAEPPAVWIDDFFQWLNPTLDKCCRVRRLDPWTFCSESDLDTLCRPCFEGADPPWNITLNGLPEGQEFMRYLRQWLISPSNEACPLGGKAGYGNALQLGKRGSSNNSVTLSHVRTYHTSLESQADYINAMQASQRIAREMSKHMGTKVFPYSPFYVFFEQYTHIAFTTGKMLTLVLLSIFAVTSVMLGSWRTGTVVVVTVFLIVVSVMGAMGAWNVSLNGISLVNLIMSCGIAVEFCSHVARAFQGALGGGLPWNHVASSRDRNDRAWSALVEVGSSVVSGITLTKLAGISVLGFTRSKILEVYFFRMWFILIVSGALHGLVLLPVALSLWGGQGYAFGDDDLDWMGQVMGSRYDHDGRPFLADDDDESDSEEPDRFLRA